ncbi:MAG: hypothetical protein M1830_009580, partial [Pleopsidium flavum]
MTGLWKFDLWGDIRLNFQQVPQLMDIMQELLTALHGILKKQRLLAIRSTQQVLGVQSLFCADSSLESSLARILLVGLFEDLAPESHT